MLRQEKGITLVALIITIIILIILAAVSVGAIAQSGLLDLAGKSTENFSQHIKYENEFMNKWEGYAANFEKNIRALTSGT